MIHIKRFITTEIGRIMTADCDNSCDSSDH